MRQTLFYLPEQLGPLDLFGVGWLLILWLFIGGLLVLRAIRRSDGKSEAMGLLPMIGLVALAIVFLVPRIEQDIPTGFATFPPVAAARGLPIRGYGVMLLFAVVSAVTLGIYRSQKAGLNHDLIFGLGFTVILAGIVGARLFFIIQYWNLMKGATLAETLGNVLSVVNGGLVVYGSLIGAAIGFLYFTYKHKLHPLALADLIAPSLALGLAIGRLGCLLNGCCFGGPCQHDMAWSVTFPAESPPYVYQQSLGYLHGIRIRADQNDRVLVSELDLESPVVKVDLAVGEQIVEVNGYSVQDLPHAQALLERSGPRLEVRLAGGRQVSWTIEQLPERSLPVHPTQLYSSLNAFLLFFLTLAYFPFRNRHGQVIALLLSLYAVTRFLLEWVRTDENAFMAQMTISQNVSVAITIGMIVLWGFVLRQPRFAMIHRVD